MTRVVKVEKALKKDFFIFFLKLCNTFYDRFTRNEFVLNSEVFDLDISSLKNSMDFSGMANLPQKSLGIQTGGNVQSEKLSDLVADKSLTSKTEDRVKNNPVYLQEVTHMTEAMNKFVQAMDANIRFTVHEKSNQLMVQVIDQANDIVLKEFPSSEFLDTMAAIRDYVGILLDKKI